MVDICHHSCEKLGNKGCRANRNSKYCLAQTLSVSISGTAAGQYWPRRQEWFSNANSPTGRAFWVRFFLGDASIARQTTDASLILRMKILDEKNKRLMKMYARNGVRNDMLKKALWSRRKIEPQDSFAYIP